MAFPGETVASGAGEGETLRGPKVMSSAAGYYIGYEYLDTEMGGEYWMPYSRESGYYKTHEDASKDLSSYAPRSTEFIPGPLTVEQLD